MTTLSKILANNIKAYRAEKSLSGKQLALLCEVHPSVITNLETGKSNPTLKRLIQVSKALNVSVSDLLTHK